MGDAYPRFPSRNTNPLPPVEFSFTNPSTSQSKQARDRLPLPLDPHALSIPRTPAQRQIFHAGTTDVTVANQPPFKAAKPGPLTSAELSSGTNAFKLRANKSRASSNPANNALLRQEIFKPAHTLAPTPQPSNKPFSSTSPAVVPLKSLNKPSSKPQLQASVGSVTPSSLLEFEPSPLLGKSNTHDTGFEGDFGTSHSDQNLLSVPPERPLSVTSSSVDYQRASDVDLVALAAPLRQEKTQTEGELRTVKSLLAEALENTDNLQAQIEVLRQHGTNLEQLSAELETLRHDAREASTVTPALMQAIEKSQAVAEEKRQQLRETIAEYQSSCAELETSFRQQQGVSDLLRDELSQVRGNYSELLELNAELRTSLAAMANEYAETSKSLAALHKQINDLTNERSDLRASESLAKEELKSLKFSLSSLTDENARIAGLLGENEVAFVKKLKLLEEQNDTGSCNLKEALTELAQKTESLESLRSAHDEALAQVEVHRREENKARERISLLVHDVELKSQCLEEARKTNESSAVRLSELGCKLNQAGEENGTLKGRLAELDNARLVLVAELKTVRNELAQSHGELLVLREKLANAATADEKVDTLERALSGN
ncbi:hypothetical protein FRC06_000315, partial [Ceratobasidium sp. 370]